MKTQAIKRTILIMALMAGALLIAGCPAASEDAETEAHAHDHAHSAEHHGVPDSAKDTESASVADPESIEFGKTVYADNCVACHGEFGRGDGPAAKSTDPVATNLADGHVDDYHDGEVYWIVTFGSTNGGMPAWMDNLSEEERWDVVNYLRTLSSLEGADDSHT